MLNPNKLLLIIATLLAVSAVNCGKDVETENILAIEDPKDPQDPSDPNSGPDPEPSPSPSPQPDPRVCGNFYDIAALKKIFLPSFDALTPLAQVYVENFDVSPRNWQDGFPGAPNSFKEWYALNFKGEILLPETGTYDFWLRSDDGAKFYISGKRVVWNDGVHRPRTMKGKLRVKLAGRAVFNLQYFQGPRHDIALQLWWKTPSGNERVIVPKTNFFGTGCQF